MIGKFLIVCLAVTCALADKPAPPPAVYYKPYNPPPPPPTTTPAPPPPPPPPAYKPYRPYSPPPPPPAAIPPYAYNYAVVDGESGVDMSADEQAEGGAVAGSYKVALPDGRIKTVTYTVAGDSGFVADVQFEGAPAPAPAPYPKYVPYNA